MYSCPEVMPLRRTAPGASGSSRMKDVDDELWSEESDGSSGSVRYIEGEGEGLDVGGGNVEVEATGWSGC